MARSRGAAAYGRSTPRTSLRAPPGIWTFLSSLGKRGLRSNLPSPRQLVPVVCGKLLVLFDKDAGTIVNFLPESQGTFFRIDFLHVPGPPAPMTLDLVPIAPTAAGEVLPGPELPLVEPSLLLIECQRRSPLMGTSGIPAHAPLQLCVSYTIRPLARKRKAPGVGQLPPAP